MFRIASLFVLALFTAALAVAGDLTPQQQKMKECNAEAGAKSLKGDERQKFMSACLSAKTPENKGTSQQEKMKTCNKDAGDKGLKGDERKKFMSACLSGK